VRDPERGPNGTHVSKVATLLWLLCAAHCFAVFVLQDSDVCFQHGGQSVLVQGQVSVTICTSVALFVPVTAFLMERRGPVAQLQGRLQSVAINMAVQLQLVCCIKFG